MKKQPLRKLLALSLWLSLAVLLPSTQAANQAWSTSSPGPADGNFSGTNWTVGTTGVSTPTNAAASGDALFFDTSAITTLNNDLSGATFAGITFNSDASAYTIGGNAFTLSAALTNNSSSLQTFSNNITFAAAQTVAAAGNITLSGTINGAGTSLTKSGTGTLTLGTSSISMTGALTVQNGTVALTSGSFAASSFSFVGSTASQTGITSVASGATLNFNNMNGGGLGYASSASGVIYNSGTFTANQLYMSDTANNAAYGYVRNADTMTIANTLQIGRNNNANLLDIVGGTTTITPTADGGLALGSGAGSTSGLNISGGGTFTLGAGKQAYINQGAGAYTSINITGAGSKLVNPSGGGFDLMKTGNASNVTTISLSNGGELDTQYMFNNNTTYGANVINFDNGTLKATGSDGNGLIHLNTTVYIYSGGATIDTNGTTSKIDVGMLTPTGSGVSSISLGGTATGYVGAPIVKITGGGGQGAAAIANFDPTTGTVTGITITAAGAGYTSSPTVTLVGGNGGSTGAGTGTATATASIAAVTGGGLTKTGSGTLTLSASNTYIGATNVNSGTLALGASGSISASPNVNIAAGAIFDTTAQSFTMLGGQTLKFTLDGTVHLAGLLNAATLNITAGVVDFATVGTLTDSAYVIAKYTSLTGTQFATVNDLPGGYELNYSYSGNQIALVQVVPEPSTCAMLLGGVGMLTLFRSRKA